MMPVTFAYAVPDLACVVQRGSVEIPDPEFQRVAIYPGVIVRDEATGNYLGDTWKGHWQGAPCWYWRTLEGSRYGRTSRLRYGVRQIVNCARVAA